MDEFPDVVITHSGFAGDGGRVLMVYPTKIVLDGFDVSGWVTDFRVGGQVKGHVELDLKILCRSLTWSQPEISEGQREQWAREHAESRRRW